MNMKTSLVAIGNSRGIRIPKPVIEQCGFGEEVEMDVRNNEIVLRPLSNPRQGWDRAFAQMARLRDDALVDEIVETQFDAEEWAWK